MFGPACTVSVPLRLSTSTDTSILQCLVVTVTAVSGAPKASRVIMYTMNNHTTQFESLTTDLTSTVSLAVV